VINEDIKPGYAPSEVSFRGFTTKNLHHSEDSVKAFQDTIERMGDQHPREVLMALKATDMYMKLNDMHLEQGQSPDEKEIKRWVLAHRAARDALLPIGEFIHHQDYWHTHQHELQDLMTKYNPETAGAEMSDSYDPQGNQLDEAKPLSKMSDEELSNAEKEVQQKINSVPASKRRVTAGHPLAVKMRAIRLQKMIRSSKNVNEETELDEAGPFSYGAKTPRKGSVAYNAMMKRKEQEKNTKPIEPKDQMVGTAKILQKEELTDKTIKSADKIKVARVIADMLGVEDAEKKSPEQAIAAGLKSVKNKRMTPELVGVIRKMVALAQEVGVKVDTNMLPKAVAEAKEESTDIDPSTDYAAARGIMRLSDFVKSKKTVDGSVVPSEVGHSLHSSDGDTTRHMKVRYKTEQVQVTESEKEDVEDTSDYKVDKAGRKYKAHRIVFKKGEDDKEDIKEEAEVDLDDKALDQMASTVDHEDDILDAYDDNEVCIVDQDTGEECEIEGVNEEVLNEVLSRSERIRARIRFIRTQSKRSRRLQVVLRRRSDSKTIAKRARRVAINMLKERIMKKPVSAMSVAEKERVEAMLSKRKALIDRLAMRLVPNIRKIENERLSHPAVTKGE